MKTVFKYPLPVDDEVRISLPAFAKVLKVGAQHDQVFVWALVDPKMPPLKYTFRIAGTGHPIVDDARWNYLDTVFLRDGALVFHVFLSDPKQELPS